VRFFRRSGWSPSDLHTPRLRLVAITPELLDAESQGIGELAGFLRADAPAEWPPAEWEPYLLATIRAQLLMAPSSVGWHRYSLLVEGRRRTLIGCLGAFAKPGGEVELGYSILPSFQRRGFGSEGAGTLVTWLLRQAGVRRVSAQSFISRPESIKVMQRCGMIFAGAGDEPGTVRYQREREN
jgi:[ribosomal protein S5]-alanine N-acetyltransferase